MEEKVLKLGKMTSREIAAWLNLTYSTYAHNISKHLEKLEDFCKFKRIRGGVEIEEIWCKYYHKDFVAETHAKILAEIKRNPINTIVNLAHSTGFTQYRALARPQVALWVCAPALGVLNWLMVIIVYCQKKN